MLAEMGSMTGSRPSAVRRWLAGLVTAFLGLTGVLVTPGVAVAECPDPSFVKVWVTNSSGSLWSSNAYLDSRNPPYTMYLYVWQYNHYVAHGGDVAPGTRAVFKYGDQFTHTTQPARSNGVIHHEPEIRDLSVLGGFEFDIYASWHDECHRVDIVDRYLGRLVVRS